VCGTASANHGAQESSAAKARSCSRILPGPALLHSMDEPTRTSAHRKELGAARHRANRSACSAGGCLQAGSGKLELQRLPSDPAAPVCPSGRPRAFVARTHLEGRFDQGNGGSCSRAGARFQLLVLGEAISWLRRLRVRRRRSQIPIKRESSTFGRQHTAVSRAPPPKRIPMADDSTRVNISGNLATMH